MTRHVMNKVSKGTYNDSSYRLKPIGQNRKSKGVWDTDHVTLQALNQITNKGFNSFLWDIVKVHYIPFERLTLSKSITWTIVHNK